MTKKIPSKIFAVDIYSRFNPNLKGKILCIYPSNNYYMGIP